MLFDSFYGFRDVAYKSILFEIVKLQISRTGEFINFDDLLSF